MSVLLRVQRILDHEANAKERATPDIPVPCTSGSEESNALLSFTTNRLLSNKLWPLTAQFSCDTEIWHNFIVTIISYTQWTALPLLEIIDTRTNHDWPWRIHKNVLLRQNPSDSPNHGDSQQLVYRLISTPNQSCSRLYLVKLRCFYIHVAA